MNPLWSVVFALGLAAIACAQVRAQPPTIDFSPTHSPTITRTPASTLSPGMATLLARWETTGTPTLLPLAPNPTATRRPRPTPTFYIPPTSTPDSMAFGMFPNPDLWFTSRVVDHPFRAGVITHRKIDDCYATVMSTAPFIIEKDYPIQAVWDPDQGALDYQEFSLGGFWVERMRAAVPGFLIYVLGVPPRYGCAALYVEVHHPTSPDACITAIEELLATYHEMPWLAPGICG